MSDDDPKGLAEEAFANAMFSLMKKQGIDKLMSVHAVPDRPFKHAFFVAGYDDTQVRLILLEMLRGIGDGYDRYIEPKEPN